MSADNFRRTPEQEAAYQAYRMAKDRYDKLESIRSAGSDLLEALECCPNMDDFDTAFEFRAVFNQWWDKQALPAIEKAKGERS